MTVPLTIVDLRLATARATTCLQSLESELNEADGKLGDGDTGQSLRRVFERMNEAAAVPATDLGAFLRSLGLAASGATGSSLGTLVAVSLLALGKANAGRATLEWPQLGAQLELCRDTMLARGGAKLGDKTVIDLIDAIARAVAGLDDPAEIAVAAAREADSVLAAFRNRLSRAGRARMYGDRSVGLDDPGMLAFAKLAKALAASDVNAAEGRDR